MGFRINTNVMALNAQRNLNASALTMSKAFERLSSGLRINRAADDAAGLAISEKLRAQIRGLSQASRNAQDGISMVQTAEGALNEVHSILQRMRELVVQAGTATVSAQDKQNIQDEIEAMQSELDRIAAVTDFNGTKLLDGTLTASILVGANGTTDEYIAVNVSQNHDAATLGVDNSAVDVTNSTLTTENMLSAIDAALQTVSQTRSGLGAIQNRLEHTVASLGVAVENLSASESRIRDADIAEETSRLVTAQILQQAGTAVLAQANAAPQSVLSLLG